MSHGQDLNHLLDRQIACFRQLLQALEDERKAISQQDPAALEGAVARKRELVAQASNLDGERGVLLRSAGLDDSREGMNALFTAQADPATTAVRWEKLMELVADSREGNRFNGAMMELGMQHLRRALNLLRGQTPEASVYGPKGRTGNGPSSRSLARA